jgi:acetoacetate decarboxylase
MGFVKTPEEIERIQQALSRVQFTGGEAVAVSFLTDPEVVAELLPPGLEPAAQPRMGASVCRFSGGSCGAFNGGTVNIAARHGDIEGTYSLAMYMDADAALLFGRGLYGEPKKGATVSWQHDGNHLRAAMSRGGIDVVSLDVELEGELTAVDGGPRIIDFNYKSSLAPDGVGLAGDAILVETELTGTASAQRGTGTVTLQGNVHDPLHEIPVRKVLGANYMTCDLVAIARELARVPGDDFLPYAYGQFPDWAAHLDEARAPVAR